MLRALIPGTDFAPQTACRQPLPTGTARKQTAPQNHGNHQKTIHTHAFTGASRRIRRLRGVQFGRRRPRTAETLRLRHLHGRLHHARIEGRRNGLEKRAAALHPDRWQFLCRSHRRLPVRTHALHGGLPHRRLRGGGRRLEGGTGAVRPLRRPGQRLDALFGRRLLRRHIHRRNDFRHDADRRRMARRRNPIHALRRHGSQRSLLDVRRPALRLTHPANEKRGRARMAAPPFFPCSRAAARRPPVTG